MLSTIKKLATSMKIIKYIPASHVIEPSIERGNDMEPSAAPEQQSQDQVMEPQSPSSIL